MQPPKPIMPKETIKGVKLGNAYGNIFPSPLMTNSGLDSKVTRKKLKKPKPISKKARKELEFKELVASTRKITGWLTVPRKHESGDTLDDRG